MMRLISQLMRKAWLRKRQSSQGRIDPEDRSISCTDTEDLRAVRLLCPPSLRSFLVLLSIPLYILPCDTVFLRGLRHFDREVTVPHKKGPPIVEITGPYVTKTAAFAGGLSCHVRMDICHEYTSYFFV